MPSRHRLQERAATLRACSFVRDRKAGCIVCTNVCCEIRNLFCQSEHSESVARPNRGRSWWIEQGLTRWRRYDNYGYTEPFPNAGLGEGLTLVAELADRDLFQQREVASERYWPHILKSCPERFHVCLRSGLWQRQILECVRNQHSRGLDLRLNDLRGATGQENLAVGRAMGAGDDRNCLVQLADITYRSRGGAILGNCYHDQPRVHNTCAFQDSQVCSVTKKTGDVAGTKRLDNLRIVLQNKMWDGKRFQCLANEASDPAKTADDNVGAKLKVRFCRCGLCPHPVPANPIGRKTHKRCVQQNGQQRCGQRCVVYVFADQSR